MAYLEQEQKIAYAASEQVIWLKDIAESLKILSGRTTLKENRLREEVEKLYDKMNEFISVEEYEKIQKKINKIEDEIYNDRIKREGGEE